MRRLILRLFQKKEHKNTILHEEAKADAKHLTRHVESTQNIKHQQVGASII